jgi:hypothetical protein
MEEGEERAGEEPKSYDCKKAWPSINPSILYVYLPETHLHSTVII